MPRGEPPDAPLSLRHARPNAQPNVSKSAAEPVAAAKEMTPRRRRSKTLAALVSSPMIGLNPTCACANFASSLSAAARSRSPAADSRTDSHRALDARLPAAPAAEPGDPIVRAAAAFRSVATAEAAQLNTAAGVDNSGVLRSWVEAAAEPGSERRADRIHREPAKAAAQRMGAADTAAADTPEPVEPPSSPRPR